MPSSKFQPYTGAQLTASIRTTLQQALDQWQPGDSTLLLRELTAADLSRSDTRSFGVTHAQELARINSAEPNANSSIPLTPPPTHGSHPPQASSHNSNGPPPSAIPPASVSPIAMTSALPTTSKASPPPQGSASPPLNPAVLNQAPAPIPTTAASLTPVISPDPTEPTVKIPTAAPTVAETGIPKSAGPDGPGPVSGSLKDIKHSSPIATAAPVPIPVSKTTETQNLPSYGGPAALESAEEEKKRLEREERERLLRQGGSAVEQPKYESAEDEKKRLEREERERILAAGGSSDANRRDSKDGDPELPPYQEF